MKRHIGEVELLKPRSEIRGHGFITPATLNSLKELSFRLKSLGHFQSVEITDVLPLSVGGNEGAKFTCKVVLKRSKTTLDCIIKSYPYREVVTGYADYVSFRSESFGDVLAVVINIARGYTFFRSNGFTVPQTARVFVDTESKVIHLLLSDLTQGGKYRIWGFSNKMSEGQVQELKEMNLTPDEVKVIMQEALKRANLLAELGVSLEYWYFHILQDKKTRKLSICFLDLDELNRMQHVEPTRFEINKLKKGNQLEVNIFQSKLLQELKKIS